jgi:hypothetical protein
MFMAQREADMAVLAFPDRFPEIKPIIISSSPSSILVAIEIPRSVLVRHRRFLKMLVEAAVEPVSIKIDMAHSHIEIPNDRDDQERLTQLRESYAPYCRFPAFDKGFAAYEGGNFSNPHDPNSDDAQAWDRGHDCAMQWHHLR